MSKKGYFGEYGGRFVPETLISALDELENAYKKYGRSREFRQELDYYLKDYAGRPTPLYLAERLSAKHKIGRIYLKREDLLHTGAHKINNTLGQVLLAKIMGKQRIIAETGAGQHGVATATVCALFDLPCVVYMGEEDVHRQSLNVYKMKLLGAEVAVVRSGSRTLKDAINEAIRDWVTNVKDTFYIIGSVVGPHPYPLMVRDFQSVIGRETRRQILKKEGRLPDYVLACVGGGSNSAGIFHAFIEDRGQRLEVREKPTPNPQPLTPKLIGVEAGGRGIKTGEHSATLGAGRPGTLHGALSYILQDKEGQIKPTHSISAGLDYPGVGPEHAYYKDRGLVEYVSVTDSDALGAFKELTETEGIIPALESSHALAYLPYLKKKGVENAVVIVNLSGRGDKDTGIVAEADGVEL